MRMAARVFVVLCALGSLACTLYAGQHNRSVLLVAMFAVWVIAPFAGLLVVLRSAGQAGTVVPAIAITLSLATLVLYAAFALHPLARTAAAPFLLLPMCSWAVVVYMFFFVRSKRAQNIP